MVSTVDLSSGIVVSLTVMLVLFNYINFREFVRKNKEKKNDIELHYNNLLVKTHREWKQIADYLYQLLDDISTTGDIAKSDDRLYRALVEKIQAKRSKVVAECDGYNPVIFKPLDNPDDVNGCYPVDSHFDAVFNKCMEKLETMSHDEFAELVSMDSEVKILADAAIENLQKASVAELEAKCLEFGHVPTRLKQDDHITHGTVKQGSTSVHIS